jgi:uncharacterized protein YeaO (DUF488 family)
VQILLKRAYEKPANSDGFRVLVDRLWPRGVKKADLDLDVWAKELAPSNELRRWFGHDEKRWIEFRKRYNRELADPKAHLMLQRIVAASKHSSAITLVYAARDTVHNEAVVLRDKFRRSTRSRIH